MYKEWKEAQASEEDRARAILPGGRSHLLTFLPRTHGVGLGLVWIGEVNEVTHSMSGETDRKEISRAHCEPEPEYLPHPEAVG